MMTTINHFVSHPLVVGCVCYLVGRYGGLPWRVASMGYAARWAIALVAGVVGLLMLLALTPLLALDSYRRHAQSRTVLLARKRPAGCSRLRDQA
jgi:hypothetical protein